MDNQNGPSGWATKGATIPLLLGCIFSTVICIVLCAIIYLSRDFIKNDIALIPGLIEPTPTPDPDICPKIPSEWVKVMDNDFNANTYNWPLGKYTDEYSESNPKITKGLLELSLKAFSNRGVYYYTFPALNISPENFYFMSTVRQISGREDSRYGVIFRENGGQHYFLSISNSGQFIVKSRNDAGAWKELWFGEHSGIIHPGENNQLVILGQDSHYTFCINQHVVGELDNEEHNLGGFGLGILVQHANDVSIFEYDDLIIYAPAK